MGVEGSGRRIGSGLYIFAGLASEEKPNNTKKTYEKLVVEKKERRKLILVESDPSNHDRRTEDPTVGRIGGDME